MSIAKAGNRIPQDLVGLVPAAGYAKRISPIPCSKEIFPVGFGRLKPNDSFRPKVAGHYLLENMQRAGVNLAYIIVRSGKWDIPAYFGNGDMVGIPLGYLTIEATRGVPYTLDQAYPFIKNNCVAMGFPDIIIHPEDAFVRLAEQQVKADADIVLGLFPADRPHKVDMVALDNDYRVEEIHIKPPNTHLTYTWLIAVWTPRFTHFMHQYILNGDCSDGNSVSSNASKREELFMGHVIQAAIEKGLSVDNVRFPHGTYIDIGTREDLITALGSSQHRRSR